MLNRERNRIVAEVFLAVEENNNNKDSRKKDCVSRLRRLFFRARTVNELAVVF